MAKPIPHIVGGYKVELYGSENGRSQNNGFALFTTEEVRPAALDLATLVATQWEVFANTVFHESYAGNLVGVYDLSETEGAQQIAPMDAIGGRTGDPAVAGTVALITHHTSVRKKWGLERLGSIATNMIQAPAWALLTVEAQGIINTAWSEFISAVTTDVGVWVAGPAQLQVLSYETAKAPDVRLIPVNSSTTGIKLSSLRTRRARG